MHTLQSSDKFSRLVEIARAYYLENRTQSEISKSLGVTRSQVSRDLKEAREIGIVQIRIVTPDEQAEMLVAQLKERFPHLKEAVIAPVFGGEDEAARALVGRYAANYLSKVIHPGQRLAIGCGRTLRAMVTALHPQEIADVTVVQAMGNLGHEVHGIDYNEIARMAAQAFGARLFYISAPAIIGLRSGKASELVEANPTIKAAINMARQADVYVVGLGSMMSDQIYVRAGMLDQSDLNDLLPRAVGDICGRFFDRSGREQLSAFADRTMGIELEDLLQASLSIGVATGVDKVAPLVGALRGKLINAVVTDENTARSIIALDDAFSIDKR